MDLKTYFENTEGVGVLSTADAEGNVDAAVYGRPHMQDDGSVGLIMQPRLSYANLQSNPKAAYLFIEKGPGYKGTRVYLEKTGEESDPEKVASVRRSTHGCEDSASKSKLVFFKVTRTRPLVGDSDE